MANHSIKLKMAMKFGIPTGKIIDTVMENEKKLCEDLNTTRLIDNANCHESFIAECSKAYFRNIHKQVLELNDPEKMMKAEEHLVNGPHFSCHAGVCKVHCKATLIYQAANLHLNGISDIMATIDTKYVTNPISYDEKVLSDSL
ncbi:hypothetical protein PAXRUDRAFT_25968 [Paxillus rubicundulus Ve08.2h10]|uniref:Uncharacterized protein n=1 Tax=Paxillus rubicundulus Ve08.2h10 TaxID=930991 RepID=A0A0D0DWL1_9AGAM|nr:hypothetical protein PAXRUDRAFT_25968 [Paxillus rubicundulus Ve08.2h10]